MGINRREFVKTVSAISLSHVLSTSTGLFAAGQEKIKLGLVGCGGRGTGALGDCLKAAEHLGIQAEIVALGDYFLDKAKQAAQSFKVSEERCFAGIDAYKKVIASEADVVLLVTPPAFRPVHFQAAIDAGKHVFMEKPVAVDAPGARQVIETGKLAAEKKLAVVAGTQRRHQAVYRRNQLAVKNGQIGKVISGRVSWLWPALWYKTRIEGESDADYMIRNWVSFTEMSGDHIVEQHLHNIDIANWFIGRPPESAMGFGGRARRKTGNQYDFFSVDFDYGDDIHIHSMSRQISGCYDRISEWFAGTEGIMWGDIEPKGGYKKEIAMPDFEEPFGPYVQEHVDLLRGIVKGEPLNEAKQVAESNLAAILGRISAYTGQLIRWRDLVDPSANSAWYNHRLSPTAEDFEKGTVVAPADDVIPIPGKS